MKKILLFLSCALALCMSFMGCVQTEDTQTEDTLLYKDMRIGKNITIVIDGEPIDSVFLRNVQNKSVEDSLNFDLLSDDVLTELINYMDESNYIITPGKYVVNQGWRFDYGEFILNNGKRQMVFAFKNS